MPAKNPDLHGNAPDRSPLALLLIDVINDLEFPEGDKLLQFCAPGGPKHCRIEAAREGERRAGHLHQR